MISICVDLGTTNTRVWLVRDDEVLARAQAQVGVRDTAREGSSARLRQTLRSLIENIRKDQPQPQFVIAAGMITSSLGLMDVPHVSAPAGLNDLSAAMRRHEFPDVTDLPVQLVPGVRSGPIKRDAQTVAQSDVMRGEETLCLGLVALNLAPPPATVLNLGSHWKLIQLDAAGRIAKSITSLSGEMIHVVQSNTILSSGLPSERSATLDPHWLSAGMKEQRQNGLARSLFCVRLLELGSDTTPAQRMAYLTGAFIASDLDAMIKTGAIPSGQPVVLVGSAGLAEAWRSALAGNSIHVTIITEEQIERAMLAGLRRILESNPNA